MNSFIPGELAMKPVNQRMIVLALVAVWLVTAAGCGHAAPAPAARTASTGPAQSAGAPVSPIDLPQPAQKLGTAVVLLIDISPSMAQAVPDHAGHKRPKNDIAREALQRIIRVTDDWHRQHADTNLYLGIVQFDRTCSTILPIAAFDAAKAQAAVEKPPRPGDGTAIGLALEEGFKALYATGCIRKHLVCITDGENTVGTAPDQVARQLYSQTKGDVEIHFIAFDTSAKQFGFLKAVNGSVVEAADGAQLQAQLIELYEKRILVEAMPAEKE
jgi:Mg-chelatase subunit ChlD